MSNKMDKYYTPSIEEFHVGFEYEALIVNDKYSTSSGYNKVIITSDDLCIIKELTLLKDQCYRVKYLDREDIESLGLKLKEDIEYPEEFNILDNDVIIGSFNPIAKIHNIELFHTYFYIKNKSELVVLLKQLKINE